MPDHDRLIVYPDVLGAWRWRRVTCEDLAVAESPYGYIDKLECGAAAYRINAQPFVYLEATETPL